MIPERFSTEIPQRMRSLLDALEPIARQQDLLTSFTLMAAMPILIIPLERIAKNRAGPRNEINDIKKARNFSFAWAEMKYKKFTKEFLSSREERSRWRYLIIPKIQIDNPTSWKDSLGRHPIQPGAINEIEAQDVENILTVMRNALAHGSIVFLDENGEEKPNRRVTFIAFVSRVQVQERQSVDFRVLIVDEESFLTFLKRWTEWISKFEMPSSLSRRIAA
jgi:hypothetical protein